jgi:hypothetical protein
VCILHAVLPGRIAENPLPPAQRQLIAAVVGPVPCLERESQAIMNVTQIKDAIRYMSQTDKIEIYRWLDGELAGDLPSRIGSRRSMAIRQEIERTWMTDRNIETPQGPDISHREL